jgi:succinoglycan biosynthesis transport protein ExoP
LSTVVERADDLLHPRLLPRRFTLGRMLRIGLLTSVVLAATAGVLLVMPKAYESTAGLLVAVAPGAGNVGAADFDAVMSSRLELIRSRELLLEVVDVENLRSVPEFAETGFAPVTLLMRLVGQGGEGRSIDETVLSHLAERISIARQPDSALLSVTARSSDPALAARIANTLARTYANRRSAQMLADAADADMWLQQEIEDQRAKLRAAETAVAEYRAENGLFLESNTGGELTSVATQIAEAQQRRSAVEGRAKMIRDLVAAGQSPEGVSDVQDSPVIGSLLQTKAGLSSELAERSTTLLANHPTIRALRAQLRELDAQVAAEATRVAAALDAEAQMEAGIEQRLRDELAAAKVSAGDAAKGGVTLVSLEREAQAQRDLLDSYLARFADTASKGGAVAATDVRMVSEAIPATEPSSPNFPMTLGIVGLAALLLQIGGVALGAAVPSRVVARALAEDTPEEGAQDQLFDEAAFGEIAAAQIRSVPVPATALSRVATGLDALANSVAAQQIHIVLLASARGGTGTVAVVERLLEDAMLAELSAVVVDAGSGDVSTALGLTDLAAGTADFGDVLQRAGENLAEVQWGRLPVLDQRSSRPMTLIEALADIYHVVIVDTGIAGGTSNLPLFTGARGTLVLVADADDGPVAVNNARRELGALGFAVSRVVTLPSTQADVA